MSGSTEVPFDRQREFRFERHHFEKIAALLYRLAGIHLAPHKFEMMYARLVRRLRALGLADFDGYCALLDSDQGADEVGFLVNAMTTNLTAFFREPHHFKHLAEVLLPALANRTQEGRTQDGRARPRLRIWSAGCSSGPEPYTIAMVLVRSLPNPRTWDARILATDIDTRMIETARAGVYPASYADSIPAEVRGRFARPGPAMAPGPRDDPGGSATDAQRRREPSIVMSPELKALITFKPLNLLEPWPMKGPFDAIFCRNVLIYFGPDTQRTLCARFQGISRPGGTLFLGHSERIEAASLQKIAQIGTTAYRFQ